MLVYLWPEVFSKHICKTLPRRHLANIFVLRLSLAFEAHIYGAVLVSKLRSYFIVLLLHFMLCFSHLMLHQLHFHAVLRIDSENPFYQGTMVCQWRPISSCITSHCLIVQGHFVKVKRSFYEGPLVLLIVCHFLMHKSHRLMVSCHFTKSVILWW